MGRTVEDACLQLAATAGPHAGDPLSHPLDSQAFLHPPPIDLSRLRVAWTEDFGQCDVDPVVRRAMREKLGAVNASIAANVGEALWKEVQGAVAQARAAK